MLRLTEAQLTQALTGLTPAERLELLTLLEAREAQEAERPIDTREPLESVCQRIEDEAAEKSVDPDAYRRASAAHREALLKISARRAKVNVPAWRQCPSSEALAAEFQEVIEMARREGAPLADELFPNRAPSPLPPDPIEVMRRKTLPRSTLRDLQDSAAPTAEDYAYAFAPGFFCAAASTSICPQLTQ